MSTFVQPTPGPQRPLAATPPRAPRSVRRTTTVDVAWPDLTNGQVEVLVQGRDLVTPEAQEPHVADELDLTLLADLADGRVRRADGVDEVLRAALLDATLRSGFSRHLSEVLADQGAQRTLVYAALDDLPGAFLVSGYSLLRAGLLEGDPEVTKRRAPKQGDVCAGWATDGPIYLALADLGRNAVPFGPAAPPIEAAEVEAWHRLPELEADTVRRRRQLDVRRAADGGLEVQSHLRDSYASDEPEMVMHEYLVEASIGADRRVRSVHVDPRVLPWEACPNAVRSADEVVGAHLDELEATARTRTSGPAGCTHLTSTLRSLADVRSLARRLAGQA